jgi:hypothetical protein
VYVVGRSLADDRSCLSSSKVISSSQSARSMSLSASDFVFPKSSFMMICLRTMANPSLSQIHNPIPQVRMSQPTLRSSNVSCGIRPRHTLLLRVFSMSSTAVIQLFLTLFFAVALFFSLLLSYSLCSFFFFVSLLFFLCFPVFSLLFLWFSLFSLPFVSLFLAFSYLPSFFVRPWNCIHNLGRLP